mmetsp:Transcript_19025/g.41442  ORF Transcript_19025/g.41442 Transcript_19025/m.41442 type:complete len:100 (-) Transcript_19025:112-411(-)
MPTLRQNIIQGLLKSTDTIGNVCHLIQSEQTKMEGLHSRLLHLSSTERNLLSPLEESLVSVLYYVRIQNICSPVRRFVLQVLTPFGHITSPECSLSSAA